MEDNYDETINGVGYVPCSNATQKMGIGEGWQIYCGDTITGTIRPPKEGEKYFPLIKVWGPGDRFPDALKSTFLLMVLGRN